MDGLLPVVARRLLLVFLPPPTNLWSVSSTSLTLSTHLSCDSMSISVVCRFEIRFHSTSRRPSTAVARPRNLQKGSTTTQTECAWSDVSSILYTSTEYAQNFVLFKAW